MYDNLNDNMLSTYVLISFSRNNMNLKIWLKPNYLFRHSDILRTHFLTEPRF